MRVSLRRIATAIAILLSGTAAAVGAGIDHLVLGAADLEAGMREFHALTGVEPVRGGEHPGAGTRNALASLGPGIYIEILAPVPGVAQNPMLPDLASLDRLTPVMWAVAVDDARAAAERLGAAGYPAWGPVGGSRRLPDGGLLEWQVVVVPFATSYLPFFIDWSEGSSHPSTTSPGGCSLAEVTVTDPAPEKLARLVEELGLEVTVEQREVAGLSFVIDCPPGSTEFHGER